MLNPEEERELERELAYEQQQQEQEAREARASAGDEEAGRAGKKTTETLLAAERVMEALEVAEKDKDRRPGDTPNPLILAYRCSNGSEYLRHVVNSVRSRCVHVTGMRAPAITAAARGRSPVAWMWFACWEPSMDSPATRLP